MDTKNELSHDYYTIQEFAGKYGYTLERALYKIKKYDLKTETFTTFPVMLSVQSKPTSITKISKNEIERYDSILTPPTVENEKPADFAKDLVARAAREIHKETGKMHIQEVLKRLRSIVKIEDQAKAIITHVDLKAGITVIGRDEPITIKTIQNHWLKPLRAEARQKFQP